MNKKLDLDKLLDVYCRGIYAMDPKTALPFWDYEFAPLFGDLWIEKMFKAAKLATKKKMSPAIISGFFKNISVYRKELIYSLFDLKVGKINKADRMFYVNFWWKVVVNSCQKDPMVTKANIVHTAAQIKNFMSNLNWALATPETSRQVGNLSMNLNSLGYGLYTDIFAHNCFENFGAYDVSKFFGGKKHTLVIKQWANLRPKEIFPELKKFRHEQINIFAIYKDLDYTVDIYTHQYYSKSAGQCLVKYAVIADNRQVINNLSELEELNDYLGAVVVKLFRKIKRRGFEGSKRHWVLARNYQFKDFFEALGMDWFDQKMLDRVKDRALDKNDYWDFDQYPKEVLFKFWKKGFDPRLDTYYKDWGKILKKLSKKNK